MPQSVLIACDHRGLELKRQLMSWLYARSWEVRDLGTNSAERCDALDFAATLATALKKDPSPIGVLICGSGQAMAITANRFQHIRAALCTTPAMAKTTREHNDANVLVLGADFTDAETALRCLEVFLTTPFLGGRYQERRDRLTELGGL